MRTHTHTHHTYTYTCTHMHTLVSLDLACHCNWPHDINIAEGLLKLFPNPLLICVLWTFGSGQGNCVIHCNNYTIHVRLDCLLLFCGVGGGVVVGGWSYVCKVSHCYFLFCICNEVHFCVLRNETVKRKVACSSSVFSISTSIQSPLPLHIPYFHKTSKRSCCTSCFL